MRWSTLFIPTLRDAPADAEAASHRLLVRGGFIRQLQSGHYSMLPLGWRVHRKVAEVIRQEMDAIGAQELLLPALHPASVWQASGRWESMGDEMFRLVDRKGADLALGMTHEEVIALLGLELSSYRDLPQMWYQIQTKFRDEPRPKSGLLRVREFAMKDSYSIDLDDAGLDRSFDLHHHAYVRIFARLGLDAVPVEASSGAMGGSASIEFMVESPAGEDDVARCGGCGYAANVERASAATEPVENRPAGDAPEPFPTPGIRTIAALTEAGHPPEHQIKTLVYEADGDLVLLLLRGDHPFLEQKFVDATGVADLRPADADRIRDALGASPGSLGAVGVDGFTIYADPALRGRSGMTTGANEDDVHLRAATPRPSAFRSWMPRATPGRPRWARTASGWVGPWRRSPRSSTTMPASAGPSPSRRTRSSSRSSRSTTRPRWRSPAAGTTSWRPPASTCCSTTGTPDRASSSPTPS